MKPMYVAGCKTMLQLIHSSAVKRPCTR